jgi:CDP-glycerol glycerophosphotransferase
MKRLLLIIKNVIKSIMKGTFTKKVYKKTFQLVGKLPVDKKLIVFESFLGKQYSDNPRAIYEYMLENHPEYKMYWSIDPRFAHNFTDSNIKTVDRFSFKWLFVMARANYWILNSRKPNWIPKPKHTVYLQTWHGTPLKKLAADIDEVHMPGTTTEKYKENFKKETANWDYLISPNHYSTEIFKRAFTFKNEMLEVGYPRNDFLTNNNNEKEIAKIKSKLGLPTNKKVILYAPTWRDDEFHAKGKYKFNLKLDLDKMKQALGEDYVIIIRAHYLISDNIDISSYKGFVYDFSKHSDIRDLYLISDLLITDYSSVFFDYAILKRPILFFVYDIEKYRDTLRGFYFDFEEAAPGPLTKTTEEIIKEINNLETNNYSLPDNFQVFYDRFCSLEEGTSSKKVVERVIMKK